MPPETDHNRMSAGALLEAFAALEVTPTEFAELVGVKRNTLKRWLRDPADPERLDPPFWVTIVVGLLLLPGGLERARTLSTLHAVRRPSDAEE